jgi:hypothetical protein
VPRSTDRRLELTRAEQRALEEARRTADGNFHQRIDIILALNSAGSPRTVTAAFVARQKRCSRKHVYTTLDMYLAGNRTPEALQPRQAGRPPDRGADIVGELLSIQAEHDDPLSLAQYRVALCARSGRRLSPNSIRRYLAIARIEPRPARGNKS